MHTASRAFTKKQCERAVCRAFWWSWVVFWDARGISGDHGGGSGRLQERPWAMPGSLEKASGLTLGPSWMTGVAFRQALGRIRALFSGLGSLLGLVFTRFWHRCAEKHLLCETLCCIAFSFAVPGFCMCIAVRVSLAWRSVRSTLNRFSIEPMPNYLPIPLCPEPRCM